MNVGEKMCTRTCLGRRVSHGQQCNVTYRKPHTFCLTVFYLILPDQFVQKSIKLLFLLFFSKTNGVCKPLQVNLHQFGKIAHFDVDFTAVGVVLVSLGFLAPQSAFPTFLPLKHTYTATATKSKIFAPFFKYVPVGRLFQFFMDRKIMY